MPPARDLFVLIQRRACRSSASPLILFAIPTLHKPFVAESIVSPFVALRDFVFSRTSAEIFRRSKKGKKAKGGGDMLLFMCSSMGFLYAFFESVPSLLQRHEMSCNWLDVYDTGGSRKGPTTVQTVEDSNLWGHSWCQMLKSNIHLLQALMFMVVMVLTKLYGQLHAASKMKKSKMDKYVPVMIFAALGPPFVFAFFTHLLEQDQADAAEFRSCVFLRCSLSPVAEVPTVDAARSEIGDTARGLAAAAAADFKR